MRWSRIAQAALLGALGVSHLHQAVAAGGDVGYLDLLHLAAGLASLAAAVRLSRAHSFSASLAGVMLGVASGTCRLLGMTLGLPGEGGGTGWTVAAVADLSLSALVVHMLTRGSGVPRETPRGVAPYAR